MLWPARAWPPPPQSCGSPTRPPGVRRARTHPSGSFPAAVAGCHEQRQRGLSRSWRSGPDAGCGRRRWRVLEPLSAFSRAPAPRHGHAPGSVPHLSPVLCPGSESPSSLFPLKRKRAASAQRLGARAPRGAAGALVGVLRCRSHQARNEGGGVRETQPGPGSSPA